MHCVTSSIHPPFIPLFLPFVLVLMHVSHLCCCLNCHHVIPKLLLNVLVTCHAVDRIHWIHFQFKDGCLEVKNHGCVTQTVFCTPSILFYQVVLFFWTLQIRCTSPQWYILELSFTCFHGMMLTYLLLVFIAGPIYGLTWLKLLVSSRYGMSAG